MKHFSFRPQGVCSRLIDFDIDDAGIIHNISFLGGCSGNTQGVAALAEGMDAKAVAGRICSIRCSNKPTSCPAQLAIAISEAINNS